jgi:hypothetical protein
MARRWSSLFAKVQWDVVKPSDLVEQGDPEIVRDCRNVIGQPERHIGLLVKGEYVPTLGILAIRCSRRGNEIGIPLGLAIPDQCWEPTDHDGGE